MGLLSGSGRSKAAPVSADRVVLKKFHSARYLPAQAQALNYISLLFIRTKIKAFLRKIRKRCGSKLHLTALLAASILVRRLRYSKVEGGPLSYIVTGIGFILLGEIRCIKRR